MHADDYYKKFALTKGLTAAKESLDYLRDRYELIILEGAGSPAEINLIKYDIANMRIARYCSAPVILVTDIDKGGSVASIMGTLSILERQYRKFIKGFVINKFRGDLEILRPTFSYLKNKTGKQVFGTIPLLEFDIPEEDSLHAKPKMVSWSEKYLRTLDKEIEYLSNIVRSSLNINATGNKLKRCLSQFWQYFLHFLLILH